MEFLTISEFAKAIGVAEVTLRQWDKSGKLKPHHRMPGGKRVYSSEQVEGYFQCFSHPTDRVNKAADVAN